MYGQWPDYSRSPRQANCADSATPVILNLGNSLPSQHEGGLASLEELLPLFGQCHSLLCPARKPDVQGLFQR
jgi:hypothetical protein